MYKFKLSFIYFFVGFLILTLQVYAQEICSFNTEPISSITIGIARPESVAFSQRGCFAVANRSNNTVAVYRFNSEDCTVVSTPAAVISNGISNPFSVKFSPDGNCIAVANRNANTVTIYTVNSDCTVNLHPITTITQGLDEPFSLAFSPNGDCLAIGNRGSQTVSIYAFNADTCTASCDPISTLTSADGINFPRALDFSPDGTCLAVVNFAPNGLSVYRINNCLAQTPAASTINFSNDQQGHAVTFSSSGNCIAYSAFEFETGNNPIVAIHSFDQSNCTVSPSAAVTLTSANGIAASRSIAICGSCLAVANFGNFNGSTVTIYSLDLENCAANTTAVSTLTGSLPFALAFSPDGNCLAVANQPSQGEGGGDDFINIFRSNTARSVLSRAIRTKYCGC